MPRQSMKPSEINALRAALEQETSPPAPEEAARALRALMPHINGTALRLAEKQAERRAVRLQAWGLAGCMALFAVLAWMGYEYREFLLATPGRWGWLAGFGVLILLLVCCLPVILRQNERVC